MNWTNFQVGSIYCISFRLWDFAKIWDFDTGISTETFICDKLHTISKTLILILSKADIAAKLENNWNCNALPTPSQWTYPQSHQEVTGTYWCLQHMEALESESLGPLCIQCSAFHVGTSSEQVCSHANIVKM